MGWVSTERNHDEQPITVGVIDDDPMICQMMRLILEDYSSGRISVAFACTNAADAIEHASHNPPDVVLADIAMPGMDGLQAARALAHLQPRPAVVFCTAYDAHALSAFDAQALDYLVKPVRAERLAIALDKVRTYLAGRSNVHGNEPRTRSQLCARLGGSLRMISVDDIRFMQPDEKYVVVHHARGED